MGVKPKDNFPYFFKGVMQEIAPDEQLAREQAQQEIREQQRRDHLALMNRTTVNRRRPAPIIISHQMEEPAPANRNQRRRLNH